MLLDEKTILAQELARTISQFWRVGRRNSSYQGIKQSEFMLLITLSHAITPTSDGIRVSDLSSRLNITSAGVTHMVNALEKGNLVERQSDPADRRVVLIKPTSAGRTLINQATEERQNYLRGLVDFLGEHDSKELIRLLSLSLVYAESNQDSKAKH